MRASDLLVLARQRGLVVEVYHHYKNQGFLAKGESASVSVIWHGQSGGRSFCDAMCSRPGDDNTETVEVMIIGRQPEGYVPCEKVALLLEML